MSYGLLLLRVVVGGTMAGHGAQKLLGWFDGPGLEDVKKMLGSSASGGLRSSRWGWR